MLTEDQKREVSERVASDLTTKIDFVMNVLAIIGVILLIIVFAA